MMHHRSIPLVLPLVLLGVCCLGMGQKKVPFSLRFYTQTAQGDTDSFNTQVTLLNGQPTYLDQIANISEHDVMAIYPYSSNDGTDTGACAFYLDPHGAAQLDSLSVAKRGTLLIETINGRQVYDLPIDRRVTDGVVVIPTGITTDEMKELLKKYSVAGQKKATKKSKKDVYSIGL